MLSVKITEINLVSQVRKLIPIRNDAYFKKNHSKLAISTCILSCEWEIFKNLKFTEGFLGGWGGAFKHLEDEIQFFYNFIIKLLN